MNELFLKYIQENEEKFIFDLTVLNLRKLGYSDTELSRLFRQPFERLESVQDIDIPLYVETNQKVEQAIRKQREKGKDDPFILLYVEGFVEAYIGERLRMIKEVLKGGLDVEKVSRLSGIPLDMVLSQTENDNE